LKELKKFKKFTDIGDAEEAKETYSKEEFEKNFSYRKGKKTVLMTNPFHVARQFRKLKETPRFWDYPEEEEDFTISSSEEDELMQED
jgi:hypothetical protein